MNEETIQTLNKIMPVVARVHGEHHPELHQMLELYNEVKTAPSAELFEELRDVTGNYAVPEDACPTCAKAYQLLETLDKAFSC